MDEKKEEEVKFPDARKRTPSQKARTAATRAMKRAIYSKEYDAKHKDKKKASKVKSLAKALELGRFKCQLCDKKYATGQMLKYHMRVSNAHA